jgi:hypothetical protein
LKIVIFIILRDSPLLKPSRNKKQRSRPGTIIDTQTIMIDRINAKKEEDDESILESKKRALKNYFNWKLEKWTHTDIEYISQL